MKKYFNILIIIAVLCSVEVYGSGGSLYTRYALGDIINSSSTRILSMGGLGVALQNNDYLSEINPANWYRINSTRIEANFMLNGTYIQDQRSSSSFAKAVFNGFKIGIPLEREYGAALVMGLTPETFVQYEVVEKTENSSTGNYTTTYEGTGGLSRLFLGSSFKLPYDFIIGASFDYYFGNIEYKSALDFISSSEYESATITDKKEFHGLGYSVGILTPDIASIFGSSKIKDMHIGASIKYVSNINTDTSYYTSSILGSKLIERLPTFTHVPFKFGIGASFIYNENYLFILDYMYQPWSKYRFDNLVDNNIRDYHKISVGVEHRNDVSRFSTFTDQIILRGGLSYEQTQYTFNGTGIDTYSLSTGISFPLTYENTIDFGFMVGLRGKKENNLTREIIYNLSVSVSFGELWFIRQDR